MKPLLLLISLIFSGCGASGPQFASSKPTSGKGQVVIYRAPSTPAGRSAKVFVDGSLIGRLPQKGYLTLDLRPGAHNFEVGFDASSSFADVSPANHRRNVTAGNRLYLRYSTEAVYGSGIGILLTSPGATTVLPDYTMRGILDAVPPEKAIPEVSKYRMGEQVSGGDGSQRR
jgi:hypothetical protein